MSKAMPVLILGQDGLSVIQPLQPGDVTPLAQDATVATLAKDATAAAILAAIQALPLPCSKATEVTIDLSVAKVDALVALGTLTKVRRLRVKNLAAATPTLKVGAVGEVPLALAAGDPPWENLNAASLYINCAATVGGTITLQVWGS